MRKPTPAATVVAWLANVNEDEVFMSVISFAELRRGLELLRRGRQRARLERWIADDLTRRFHGRVLLVDRMIAEAWGRIRARASRGADPSGPWTPSSAPRPRPMTSRWPRAMSAVSTGWTSRCSTRGTQTTAR